MDQKSLEATWHVAEDAFPEYGTVREKIIFLLRYAVLAPSTHNVQPWRFRVTEKGCTFFFDPESFLPQADPTGRDLYISMGCCIENFMQAAPAFGMKPSVRYCVGEGTCVADVIVEKGEKTQSELFPVLTRRSNARGLFEAKPVPKDIVAALFSTGGEAGVFVTLVQDQDVIRRIAQLTADGLVRAYQKTAFRKEMARWIRTNISKKRDGIPGYALRLPLLPSFLFPYLVRWVNPARKIARANYESMASAPLFCVFSIDKDNPLAWVRVGRYAERLMLLANAYGLATSIFVAAIEMGLQRKVQEIAKLDRAPQFLFCVGFMGMRAPHTPRYTPQERLV